MDAPLRFAVLHHTGVELPHYDLLFETADGSPLTAYRCDRWPVAAGTVLDKRLADHRRIYLEYEGEISGGRGSVRRVARGRCSLRITGDRAVIDLDSGESIELIWQPPNPPAGSKSA